MPVNPIQRVVTDIGHGALRFAEDRRTSGARVPPYNPRGRMTSTNSLRYRRVFSPVLLTRYSTDALGENEFRTAANTLHINVF